MHKINLARKDLNSLQGKIRGGVDLNLNALAHFSPALIWKTLTKQAVFGNWQ